MVPSGHKKSVNPPKAVGVEVQRDYYEHTKTVSEAIINIDDKEVNTDVGGGADNF